MTEPTVRHRIELHFDAGRWGAKVETIRGRQPEVSWLPTTATAEESLALALDELRQGAGHGLEGR